jgi:hypothetical protein
MAHFAKLTENNIVSTVLFVSNDVITDGNGVEQESLGQQHLQTHHNWPANLWVMTSYNTKANTHKLDGTPFRGNYAGIGYTWDSENEIFWAPQPYPSWTKNITNANWEPPVAQPEPTEEQITQINAGTHIWNTSWNESTQTWDIEFRETS